MSILRTIRQRTAVLVVAVAASAGGILAVAPAAQASAGYPASCSTFRITYLQRDYGAAIAWVLEHDCAFSPEITEVVVTTSEDGIVRDRHSVPVRGKFVGRTTEYVLLAPKRVCGSSLVHVEATYRYMSVGDRVSTEGRLYYDPNDNC